MSQIYRLSKDLRNLQIMRDTKENINENYACPNCNLIQSNFNTDLRASAKHISKNKSKSKRQESKE